MAGRTAVQRSGVWSASAFEAQDGQGSQAPTSLPLRMASTGSTGSTGSAGTTRVTKGQ